MMEEDDPTYDGDEPIKSGFEPIDGQGRSNAEKMVDELQNISRAFEATRSKP
jgi:hypothetical protein